MNERNLRESFRFTTKDVVLMGILIATEVVLSRFLSLSLWNIKIGFAFVPVVIAAIKLGPIKAGTVAALGDFVGAMLFPIGQYFPGFTFTAFLMGMTHGIFLYEKQTTSRIITGVLINQLIFSLLLNTLWISILYGAPYQAVLVSRLVQTAILVPVQIAVISILNKSASRVLMA
ncbi:MAG: folate family ECF transporter S component [Tissierellia bacterium]|nr:folate family ECF transporter S component [Tissierellia bacterium]